MIASNLASSELGVDISDLPGGALTRSLARPGSAPRFQRTCGTACYAIIGSTQCKSDVLNIRRNRCVPLPPGTLPIKGHMLFGVEVIRIEFPNMRQQCFGEVAAFHLVVGERSLQVLVQCPKRAVAVDSGKFAVVIDDIAIADYGAHGAGFGPLQNRI